MKMIRKFLLGTLAFVFAIPSAILGLLSVLAMFVVLWASEEMHELDESSGLPPR